MSIFDLFKKIETPRATQTPPEFLVIGLGNPGLKYEGTRHNVGFMAADFIAKKLGVSLTAAKWRGLYAPIKIAGRCGLLIKPQTFMNLSGECVREFSSFYKILPENIIVIYDDISLEPGKLRVRRRGSDGGHNGIKSIIACLADDGFPRVKLGVGAKPHPEYDLADWVLSRFTEGEKKEIEGALSPASEAVTLIVENKIDEAMNKVN